MPKPKTSRVRIFFADVEGESETVADAVRQLSGALGRTGQPKVVVMPGPAGLPSPPMEDLEDAIEEVLDAEVSEPTAEPVKSSGQSKQKRKSPKLHMVGDLDLMPDGKRSFEDFWAEKKPVSQPEQIVVAAYWLTKIAGVEEPDSNHIYTCFKKVGERIPPDLPAAVRQTKQRKGTVDTDNKGHVSVTIVGENVVEQELPRDGGNGGGN